MATEAIERKFEYELVQLNPSVQHLKVISFASSNEKPLYYWATRCIFG